MQMRLKSQSITRTEQTVEN